MAQKHTPTTELLTKLVSLRTAFANHHNFFTERVIMRMRHRFYEHGDKCGKLLACLLRSQVTRKYIHSLQSRKGGKLHSSPQIAQEFQRYYTELYQIQNSAPPPDSPTQQEAINGFLDTLP